MQGRDFVMLPTSFYAMLSSDGQEQKDTSQSQLAELSARVTVDGSPRCDELIDESYARDNLVRPGLDRLSDLVAQGDIIVAGRNFGCGSSREQAATALIHRGIRMVIAASFSQTYKRNAFNNGFIVFECPDLVADLRKQYAEQVDAGTRTIPTTGQATVNFTASTIAAGDRTYTFTPLGPVPQELVIAGGAEALVKKKLASA